MQFRAPWKPKSLDFGNKRSDSSKPKDSRYFLTKRNKLTTKAKVITPSALHIFPFAFQVLEQRIIK